MQCSEIMKRRVTTIPPKSSAAEAARLMGEAGCGMLPVCGEDLQPLGVITDRDIALRVCGEGLAPAATPVDRVMTREVISCAPSADVGEAEELMIKHRKSRILIIESERLQGVLSLADIAQCEQPLRLAQVVRDLTAREFRVESH